MGSRLFARLFGSLFPDLMKALDAVSRDALVAMWVPASPRDFDVCTVSAHGLRFRPCLWSCAAALAQSQRSSLDISPLLGCAFLSFLLYAISAANLFLPCFCLCISFLSLYGTSAQAMARQRSNSSEAMVKFLKDRVESNQGISLQKLTGHLSQLPSDLRTKYGCSVKSLKIFLQQFPKVFVIRNQSNVFVRTRSRRATTMEAALLDGSMESFQPSASDRDDDDVTSLSNVVGTVYRIFNVYGFISVKYPIKTSVYFDVQAFENAKYNNLPSSGLQVNDTVVLDAKSGPRECEAKFRASHVARVKQTSNCSSPGSNSVTGSSGGNSGLPIVNQYGVIETVKSNYGFIKFGPKLKERAFFHANNVDRSLGRSIKNLPDVLTVDDRVRFHAKPSKKPSDKVKWEAIMVCLSRKSEREGSVDDDESGNEVFMSEDESDIRDVLHDKDSGSRDGDIDESHSLDYLDWNSCSTRADFSDTASIQGKVDLVNSPLSGWEAMQKVSSERGFLYPVSEAEGTIKYGINKASTARATVGVTYRDNEPLDNLLWEVSDGQEVSFDAVDAGNNKWVATLVWIGQRPALPHVGDSEDIFNNIVNKGADVNREKANSVQEPVDDFGKKPGFRQSSSLPPPCAIQPCVSIYESAKATILKSMECLATCKVKESGVFRKIDFTSDCFYKDGTIFFGDLNEVLHPGSTVCLDYMVGINRGGKEIVHFDVVWQGKRPRGVPQMSPEEFSKRLRRDFDTTNSVNTFGDFEPEANAVEEEPRLPSRVPSDEAANEDNEESVEDVEPYGPGVPGSSSSTSMTRNPPNPLPDVESSVAFDHIPGNRKGGCGDMPEASFFSSDVNDEVLQRLAKMVAAEIIAERERTRIVLRDVGVQTEDGNSLLSSLARAKSKPPKLVSSSTQTLSTGGIKSEELFIN